jgi:hypothetical protein
MLQIGTQSAILTQKMAGFDSNDELFEARLQSASGGDVLPIVCEAFAAQAGTIHRLVEPGVLKLDVALGIPDVVLSAVQVVPFGKGIAGLAAQQRQPISLCNLQTDTSGQARLGAKSTGMEGSVAVPMFLNVGGGDGLCGVLGIAKVDAYTWSPAEHEALMRIGRMIALRWRRDGVPFLVSTPEESHTVPTPCS